MVDSRVEANYLVGRGIGDEKYAFVGTVFVGGVDVEADVARAQQVVVADKRRQLEPTGIDDDGVATAVWIDLSEHDRPGWPKRGI